MAAPALELNRLIAKIVYYAVDLLNHRLRQYLHFNADLDGRNRPTTDKIARIGDGILAWNYFTESPIPPSRWNATTLVLDIENAVLAMYHRINQFRRAIDCDEVLVKMHRNIVALIRRTMFIDFTFKQSPELH